MYRHEISQQLWTTTMKFCLTWRVTESSQSPLSNAVYQAASKSVQNHPQIPIFPKTINLIAVWIVHEISNQAKTVDPNPDPKPRLGMHLVHSPLSTTIPAVSKTPPQPQKFARMLNSIPSWIVEWIVPRSLEDEFTIKEVPILHHSRTAIKRRFKRTYHFV